MFDDLDPKEFEDTASAVIETCAGATDTAERARVLAEAGLLGVTAPEGVGGLGLPMRFAIPIVAAAGGGLLAYPLIEALLLSKALAGTDPETASAICTGKVVATIAWTGTEEDGAVSGAPLGGDASHVLIFRSGGNAVLAKMDSRVEREDSPSFDLEAPEATFRILAPLAGVEIDAEKMRDLIEEAKLLRAALVLGSAARCLSLAVDHAQNRVQFGRPLSANQVLRHRLSRAALAVETLRNGIARALSEPTEDPATARNAAWLGAAEIGPEVAESAIQIFGGMGFTWEVPLHRHLRQMRTHISYGAGAEGIDALGAHLLCGSNNTWYGEIANVV